MTIRKKKKMKDSEKDLACQIKKDDKARVHWHRNHEGTVPSRLGYYPKRKQNKKGHRYFQDISVLERRYNQLSIFN